MKTEFINYRDSDYSELKNMIVRLYQEDPEGEPMDEGKILKTIDASRANPSKVRIYMFKCHDLTIGYAILVHFWSNEYGGDLVIVDEMYVKENYREIGAASAFLNFVSDTQSGVAIQVEVTPSNKKALAYYQRLKFIPSPNIHLIKK